MKKTALFCFVFLLTTTLKGQSSCDKNCLSFSINLTIANIDSIEVGLQYEGCNGKFIRDTIAVRNGMGSYYGKINGVTSAWILTDINVFLLDDLSVVDLIIEPGNMNLKIHVSDGVATIINVTGSESELEKIMWEKANWPILKNYSDLRKAVSSIMADSNISSSEKVISQIKYDISKKDISQKVFERVANFPNSYFSGYLLRRYFNLMSKDSIELAHQLFSNKIQNSSYGKMILSKLNAPPGKQSRKAVSNKENPDTSKSVKHFFDITLADTLNIKADFFNFKGKPSVVYFWASWCGPCKKELPYLKELYKKIDIDSVNFLSISIDEDIAKWKGSLKKYPFPGFHFIDPDKVSKTLCSYPWIPYYFVFDADGKLVGNAETASMDEVLKILRSF